MYLILHLQLPTCTKFRYFAFISSSYDMKQPNLIALGSISGLVSALNLIRRIKICKYSQWKKSSFWMGGGVAATVNFQSRWLELFC